MSMFYVLEKTWYGKERSVCMHEAQELSYNVIYEYVSMSECLLRDRKANETEEQEYRGKEKHACRMSSCV